MSTTKFWAWFNEEREKRGLSIRAVERRGGVGTATIGGRERQNLPPTYEVCRAISRAFGIPLEEVLRRADLLPPSPDDDPRLKELIHWFSQLDETAQEIVLSAIRGIVEQQRHEQEVQVQLKPDTGRTAENLRH